MAALPKRRWSTHRQGRRRRTLRVVPLTTSTCQHCGKLKVAHRRCPHCLK